MTILEALKQLRDDLRLWCTNNLNKKLNKNLGSEKSGKLLVVDVDGDIVTTEIAQTTGDRSDMVMSQKAITELVGNIDTLLDNINGEEI